jgi:putative endopeptidase
MRLARPLSILALALVCSAALAQSAGKPKFGDFGFDMAGMDAAVAPGDDFYAFANGTWTRTQTIPPDRSNWGTFAILAEQANLRLRKLMEAAAAAPGPAGSPSQQAGDLYAAYMDEAAIEARGLEPARPGLAAIAAIADRRQLAQALGTTLRADVDPLNDGNFATPNLLGAWIGEDLNHPDRYIAYLFQGGLSLPDPSYYLAQTARAAAVREAFKAHVAKMFALAGFSDAPARADAVVALETDIARTHVDVVTSQDVTSPTPGGHARSWTPRLQAWTGAPTLGRRAWATRPCSAPGNPRP